MGATGEFNSEIHVEFVFGLISPFLSSSCFSLQEFLPDRLTASWFGGFLSC
jgi:hypothetical protein